MVEAETLEIRNRIPMEFFSELMHFAHINREKIT
jgi:hypothetical protein